MVSNVDLIAASVMTANLVLASTTDSVQRCIIHGAIYLIALLFLLQRNVEIDFYDEV